MLFIGFIIVIVILNTLSFTCGLKEADEMAYEHYLTMHNLTEEEFTFKDYKKLRK